MKLKILFFPLSIMLALVIFIWMTKPDWNSLKNEKNKLKILEAESDKIDGQLQSLDAAYSQFSKISDDKTLINNAIPPVEKPDELIAEFYLKAKESEVFIVSAKMEGANKNASCSQVAEIPAIEKGLEEGDSVSESTTDVPSGPMPCLSSSNVNLSLAGSYINLKKFLGQIEKMNRFSMTKGFSISKGSAEEQGDVLSMTVDFEIFTKDQPEGFTVAQGLATATGEALLGGKIDKSVIDQYKQSVTDRIFQPVGVEGAGKEDIFK